MTLYIFFNLNLLHSLFNIGIMIIYVEIKDIYFKKVECGLDLSFFFLFVFLFYAFDLTSSLTEF
jgi:hypothetical protein